MFPTTDLLPYIFIPLGILCLFRPMLLLYLFVTVPALAYIPKALGDFQEIKLLQLGSLSIYIIDYLVLIMALIFIKTLISRKNQFFLVFSSPIAKIIVFYFAWELFIGLLSFMKGFSLQNIMRRFSGESLVFLAVLVPLIDDIDRKKEKFLIFSIFLATSVVIFSLLKYGIFHEYQLTSSETYRTLASSAVTIIIFPLCYVLFHEKPFKRHQIFFSIFIGLSILGIHFAGHRSGWIVLFFVLSAWYFLNEQKIKLSWVPLWACSGFIGIVLCALFVGIQPKTLTGDFLIRIYDTVDIHNQTTQERLSKWGYSVSVISQNPLLGLGRFPVYSSQSTDQNPLARLFPELNRAPHNLIANKAVHEGVLGVLILVLFLYFIFRKRPPDDGQNKNYLRFLKIFMAAFIIYSMFNTSFSNISERQYFFIALGLLLHEEISYSFRMFQKRRQL